MLPFRAGKGYVSQESHQETAKRQTPKVRRRRVPFQLKGRRPSLSFVDDTCCALTQRSIVSAVFFFFFLCGTRRLIDTHSLLDALVYLSLSLISLFRVPPSTETSRSKTPFQTGTAPSSAETHTSWNACAVHHTLPSLTCCAQLLLVISLSFIDFYLFIYSFPCAPSTETSRSRSKASSIAVSSLVPDNNSHCTQSLSRRLLLILLACCCCPLKLVPLTSGSSSTNSSKAS